MDIQIRQAERRDVDAVSAVLTEAAVWLESRGMRLWHANELTRDRLVNDVSDKRFFLAEHDGHPVGTIRFQLADLMCWADVPQDGAAFILQLALRPAFRGETVS